MKIEVQVPNTLNDVTLGQYQKFLNISKDKEDSLFLNQKMVEIFCEIDLKQVLEIKYKSFEKIILHLSKLFEQKPEFIPSFNKEGERFSFIPQLDDMTFGEYIDLDTTLKDWDSMDKAMGVLFRPETQRHKHKYLIEPYETYDKYDMKNMPLGVALGAMVFFYNLGKALIISTPNCLVEEARKLTSQQKQTLIENGDFIAAFMVLVKEVLPNMMKLPNSLYTNA
tara:strand:+ start:41 stop:712 length:672 start_codon:yes stop_codon:yes gene_type:complete